MQHMKTFILNGLAVNDGKSGLLNVVDAVAMVVCGKQSRLGQSGQTRLN